MMTKVVKGAVLGGLVFFIWGMISWMVLPWHSSFINTFKNEEHVAQVMRGNAPTSGLYALNTCDEKASTGPSVWAAVSFERLSLSVMMVEALIFRIAVAALVTWLALQTKFDDKKKMGFIAGMGVAIALSASLPQWIWLGYPTGFTLCGVFDDIIGWVLAGAAIVKITK